MSFKVNDLQVNLGEKSTGLAVGTCAYSSWKSGADPSPEAETPAPEVLKQQLRKTLRTAS